MDGTRFGHLQWFGAAIVGLVAMVVVASVLGDASDARGHDGLVPAAAALPPRFQSQAPEVTEERGLDSVDVPTRVEAHEVDAGTLLILSGSHDALESMLPPGLMAATASNGAQSASAHGWHYLVTWRPGDPVIEEVAMIHAPDAAAFPASAAELASGARRDVPVATGDISALTNGAASTAVTYRTSGGDEKLIIQRYPSARLDPILEHFAPLATPTEVGSSPGYFLEGGGGPPVLAAEGPDGELVVVASTELELDRTELLTVARSAISW